MRKAVACFVFLGFARASVAQETSGQVQIPLELYQRLVEQSRSGTTAAPAPYALGAARVQVQVEPADPAPVAEARVDLAIEVFENEWVLVPVLPAGTAVGSVTVGGAPAQLVATPAGLAWSTKSAGSHRMQLAYRVDAIQSDAGMTLALPLPAAASILLQATLPGTGLDVAVIPGAGVKVVESGGATQVSATVPATQGVQLSWRTPASRGHALSRAVYSGRLQEEAFLFTGEMTAEIFGAEAATISLLPRSVTLAGVSVDGKPAPILVERDRFATLVRGRGTHRIDVQFQVPVARGGGPPRIALDIPPIPVSRFELTIPGKKRVSVEPLAAVSVRPSGATTVATVNVPMTPQVSFSWSEAIPEAVEAELRSNASIYHLLHAEEGVLSGRAVVEYEVNRGETNVIELALPEDVQVNRVSSTTGAIADWRVTPAANGEPRTLSVFLDRDLREGLVFEVHFDRSLGAPPVEIPAPFLRVLEAQRQRGMLALLASRDLALEPAGELDEARLTRVGENQLPAFVRETVKLTVAHTFKYSDAPAPLSIRPAPPARVQGRFDAQIDTLLSLDEAALIGTASIELRIKSGRIMGVEVELPSDVNLLHLTAPALRSHAGREDGGRQVVAVEFTQEMEGDVRIELGFERILGEGQAEIEAPRIRVREAEVEQGRIAVEARSALEVQPVAAEELATLDPSALPRLLLLRTTNPVLMAYKYTRADPPHRLALGLTRHPELSVREAAIDDAHYRSLFTRDGLIVTTARFLVRNQRKQFLRVDLPRGSEVWSVSVGGRPQRPASASDDSVLIRILDSTEGFPVELVYATRGGSLGSVGAIAASLPRPDILVTETRWDAYCPTELTYGKPRSNLNLVGSGQPISAEQMSAELGAALPGPEGEAQALRIQVPARGIHFGFAKLYANEADEAPWIRIPYATTGGALLGYLLSLAGVGALFVAAHASSRRLAAALLLAGLVLLSLPIGRWGLSAFPALLAALLFTGFLTWLRFKPRLTGWRRPAAESSPETS